MNLGIDLSLKLQQKLSFQMIQSLKLLQVNTLQLEQLLRTELEINPVLETVDDIEEILDPSEESNDDEGDLEVSENEIDWEEYLEDGFDTGFKHSDEYDPNKEYYEKTPVYKKSLEEHLNEQLSEKKAPDKIISISQYIISCLDNDGYLRISTYDIAAEIDVSVFNVEEALNIIWQMEPSGIGARSLQECLVLQLRRLNMQDSLIMRIVSEEWKLFERVKIQDISKKFKITPKDVQNAIADIKRLNPKPGYLISGENESTITPDLLVEKVDGDWIITLNDRSVPMLHISKTYADMLKRGSTANKDVKKYVREKFNGATWLIRSIEQRKSTMLKVMYAILDKQPIFFEKGPPNLNPLKLQDIADMIEMHISTVSRVTNNKYAQTPHGIFELKYFFSEALGIDADGIDISTLKIKTRLMELIENEDKKIPLSDQKLSDLLKKEKLAVARRTVAKYREQLKLLPARLRQVY